MIMRPKRTVLIVDDRQDMVATLSDILEERGLNTVMALDGYQAVKCVKRSIIDLALIDIVMPNMNGLETFREIKKFSPQTAVIMMTAFTVESLVREAHQEGAYAMFYKPLDLGKIISVIEDYLSGPLILIVDDRETVRENFKYLLCGRGYNVRVVESGYEAIQKVKEQRYDVVFLDMVMPGLDGENTFIEIRKIIPDISVIVYSGYPAETVFKRCVERGAFACLSKLDDPEKVIKITEDVVAENRKIWIEELGMK
jgi:two-component system, NtrC family, response regulator HydG